MALSWVLFLLLFQSPAGATMEEGLRLMKEERYDKAVVQLEREAKAHPGSAEVLTNLGWAYWHVHRIDEAHECWSMLVKLDPKNPTFLRLLASLEVERKNYKKAEELSRKALKLAPEEKEASVVLARALLGQGSQKEALEILEELISARPRSPSVRFGLADLLAQFNRPQDSLAYLDGLIEAEPSNAVYRKRRAQVLYDLGRIDQSMREWERLAEQKPPDPEAMLQLGWIYLRRQRTEDAARLSSLLAQLDPGNPSFLRFAVNVELQEGRFEKAGELARRAMRLDAEDKENALLLAKALTSLGRHKEAMDVLQGLIHSHPGNPAVRYEMADVLVQMGRAEDSLATLDDLLRSDPGNDAYRKRRAQILSELGRLDEAEAAWKLLADKKPPDPQALLNLGWIYMKTKRREEAFKTGSLLMELDPSNPTYLRFMAAIELERENYASAVKLAREAVRAAPQDRDNSVVLARVLIVARKEDEGRAILERLIREHKDDVSVWVQMAGLHSHLAKFSDALVFYDKIAQAEPDNVNWRRNRAEVLYQMGRFREATAEWKSLARLNPPDVKSLKRLVDDAYFRKAWSEFFDRESELEAFEPPDAIQLARIENAYTKMEKWDKAAAAAERYIQFDPVNLDGYFMKAEALESLKDFAGAKAVYKYCLARNPHNRRAMDALTRIAGDQGNYDEAVRLQNQIEETYPSEKAYPYLALRKASWLAESGKTEAALAILERFTRQRPTSVPALLYHGISPVDRADAVSAATFRAHMKALKRAGYHPVTANDFVAYLREGKPLPKKPIMVTFDDARNDSFRNADPILADLGWKATMFVHLTGLTKYPFHASLDDLKRWHANGRWEIQYHSAHAHETMPVDGEGHVGRFLANRKWLADQQRMETADEFKARVEGDYSEGKAMLQENFPDQPISAFAFPFGEYGQLGAANIPEAALINRALVQKHFVLAFIQDAHGYNSKYSLRSELTRFEPQGDMSAEALVMQLSVDEPWVKAKLIEARVWVWMGRPERSLEIIRDLERQGIKGPELYAQKGIVLEKLGMGYDAQELYALASSINPAEPGYQDLFRRAERDNGATAGTDFQSFSDNTSAAYSKALVRLGAPVRAVQLSGSFGRAAYSQNGAPRADGTEAGLDMRYNPIPTASLQASYGRRQYSGGGVTIFDTYGLSGSYFVKPGLKAAVELSGENLPYAGAIAAGIRRTSRGATVEWAKSIDTTLVATGDLTSFSDGNSQRDLRFEMLRRLTDWVGLGYSFWYGDSAAQKREYWTPRGLKQHMVLAEFSHSWGPLRAKFQYGVGYGYEGLNSSRVQSVRGGFDWRTSDYLSLTVDASYGASPIYVSREINVGIGLRF